MQFLTSLIGGSGNTILNAALALAAVIVLIILALWVLKLVMHASNKVVRGSKRRLAVVDTLPVDGKRQLVIIRRDNVEHLLLTGGPQDMLIEGGIAIEAQQPATARPVPLRRPGMVAQPPAPQPATPQPAPPPPQLQRAPAPQRAMEAEAIIPMPSNDEGPRSPLDRLRDLGRTPVRRPGSLRHTGLMRPVTRMDPGTAPQNGDAVPTDSATTGRVMPFSAPREGGGQGFGGNDSGQRDEGY